MEENKKAGEIPEIKKLGPVVQTEPVLDNPSNAIQKEIATNHNESIYTFTTDCQEINKTDSQGDKAKKEDNSLVNNTIKKTSCQEENRKKYKKNVDESDFPYQPKDGVVDASTPKIETPIFETPKIETPIATPKIESTKIETLESQLIDTFFVRTDCFGDYKTVELGQKASGFCNKAGINEDIIRQHLDGLKVIGSYPIAGNQCKWGGFDLDSTKEAKLLYLKGDTQEITQQKETLVKKARAICEYLKNLGFTCFIEDSVGGYHIWILFDSPIDSHKVFAFLQGVKGKLQLGSVESFPKQAETEGFGNFLRLPGRYHSNSNFSKLLLDDGKELFFKDLSTWEYVLALPRNKESLLDSVLSTHERKQETQEIQDTREYNNAIESQGDERLKEIIVYVLSQSSGYIAGYDDWYRFAASLKSMGLSYSEVDQIFATCGGNYNCEQNRKLFEKMHLDRITSRTAYYYAKLANPDLLKERLSIKKCQYCSQEIKFIEKLPPNLDIFFVENGMVWMRQEVSKKRKSEEEQEKQYKTTIVLDSDISLIRLVDDAGNISYSVNVHKQKEIIIKGSDLVNLTSFRGALGDRGVNYKIISQATHSDFVDWLKAKKIKKDIRQTQFLGMIEDGYLFHDCLVNHNGSIIAIEDCGIKPPPADAGKKMVLSTSESFDPVVLHDSLQKVCCDQTPLILGFAISSLFQNIIVDKFSHFPLLFLGGRRHTGKSTIAKTLQSLLGMHKSIGEQSFGTQKSWQRLSCSYKNGILILNEFRSDEQSNRLLCSLHDREGYSRAKKDHSLDIESIPVNSSFVIVTTQGITGAKSEDVQTRMVNIDSNDFLQAPDGMMFINENMDDFCSMIPKLLAFAQTTNIVDMCKARITENRRGNNIAEQRIIENHSICEAGYIFFCDCFNIPKPEIKSRIATQVKEVKDSDIALQYVKTLVAMVLNKKIQDTIARITPNPENTNNIVQQESSEPRKLIFSLSESLPLVKETRAVNFSNLTENTLGTALRAIGAIKEQGRKLGENKKYWVYSIIDE